MRLESSRPMLQSSLHGIKHNQNRLCKARGWDRTEGMLDKMWTTLRTVSTVAGMLAILANGAHVVKAQSGLTVPEFKQLHQKLTKMSTERVWSIRWQLSLREARELAAKEKKPVLLWISSNGGTHPLGPC